MARTINLALQGGGAHGAFAWGVLDRLLETDEIEIAGISGTSAGAMNGAALAAGLAHRDGAAGRRAARQNLEAMWTQIAQLSDNRMVRWMHSLIPMPPKMQRAAEMFSPVAWLEGIARVFSPYDSGPFYTNPLGSVLRDLPYPLRRRGAGQPRFFVTATNVRTGRVRIFQGDEVTPDAIMASACLPTLFRAVELDDPATGRREAYWDGGYSGNPALFPLFATDLPADIVIVAINPMVREALPRTPTEIQDRIDEISFNSSLQRELRAIQFVKRLAGEGRLNDRGMKIPLIHLVSDDVLMTDLTAQTKLIPSPGLLVRMKEAGRAAGQRFLDGDAANIGTRDSVDLPLLYG